MTRVMDDWTKLLDQGIAVDVVYMDFMKAFDKVSHTHLIPVSYTHLTLPTIYSV